MATIMVRLDEKRTDTLRDLAITEKRRLAAQAEVLLERALDTVQFSQAPADD